MTSVNWSLLISAIQINLVIPSPAILVGYSNTYLVGMSISSRYNHPYVDTGENFIYDPNKQGPFFHCSGDFNQNHTYIRIYEYMFVCLIVCLCIPGTHLCPFLGGSFHLFHPPKMVFCNQNKGTQKGFQV